MKLSRFTYLCVCLLATLAAQATNITDAPSFTVSTKRSALVLCVADDGHVYQAGFGKIGKTYQLPAKLNRQDEFHPEYGSGYISEPAIQITHADGNTSADLVYVKHETRKIDDNIS